ncbi:PREDICTED: ATP synthase subunit delta, mitochondrial-like, partial [Amphimedon queenslandica]
MATIATRRFLIAGQCLLRRPYSTAEGLPLTFASPRQAFYHNVNVRQVDVSSTNGSFGILPSHVPAIAVLKPGLVNVYENESTTAKYFVSSGSVTINADSSVQILAEEAYPLDQFDIGVRTISISTC